MTTKEELQQLVDDPPDTEMNAAYRYLEYRRDMADPLLGRLLTAQEEDEELAPTEKAAVDKGWKAHRRGEMVPDADLGRELDV